MNPILVLVRKDVTLFLKDRASLVLTFVVPFVLIYIFGQVFGVNQTDKGPSGIPVAVVNQSDNPAAARLVEALKGETAFKVLTQYVNDDKTTRPLREEDLVPMMRDDDFRFALVIPADVVQSSTIGIHLKAYSNPRNAIEAQTVNGLLQKTIFTHVPELLGESLRARALDYLGQERIDRFDAAIADAVSRAFGGDREEILKDIHNGAYGIGSRRPATAGSSSPSPSDVLSRVIHLDNVQVVGKDVKSPEATMLVGGWAIQFLLFALTASATALFRERDAGIFQRVLSAPVTRRDILLSKFLYGILLGLVQLVVLFFAGHLLYGIEVLPYLAPLVLVCVFAAAACTGFGMLIAAVSPTPEAARGIATFVILVMCALGGAWFPVSFMSAFIQKFSRLTVVYWSMEGFSRVLWSHASLAELGPTLGILALMAALTMGVSVWLFNRGNIFD